MSIFRPDPTPGVLTTEDKAGMLAWFVGLMLAAMSVAAFCNAAGLFVQTVDLGFLEGPLTLFSGALLIYLKPPGNGTNGDTAPPVEPPQ